MPGGVAPLTWIAAATNRANTGPEGPERNLGHEESSNTGLTPTSAPCLVAPGRATVAGRPLLPARAAVNAAAREEGPGSHQKSAGGARWLANE